MDGDDLSTPPPDVELSCSEDSDTELQGQAAPREKVRTFPTTPGVYLMKDAQGRVIYVGKAVNLRSRAGSYFTKAAELEFRTAKLVPEIADIDYIDADSEVDALLIEARLIKDIQPRFNAMLKDDKTFPYLQITTHEDFPRVEFTRQPETSGVKLYGPFTNAGQLRGTIAVLQRIFRFRTCTLDIAENDERWRWFRPCLLASIDQCTAPCNLRISKEDYREDIRRLRVFLDGGKASLLKEMATDMLQASKELKFEKAARIRDEIESLKSLSQRGDLESHAQPEVFYIDPQKGLAGLKKVLKLNEIPRRIEGVDIAHLQGSETVASLVQFIDGMPFKAPWPIRVIVQLFMRQRMITRPMSAGFTLPGRAAEFLVPGPVSTVTLDRPSCGSAWPARVEKPSAVAWKPVTVSASVRWKGFLLLNCSFSNTLPVVAVEPATM